MAQESVERNTKADPPRGKLPALKVPDAKALVDRLADGKTAGILSRQARRSRVGQPQWLVNELEPTKAKAASVWAVVVQDEPQRFRDLSAVPAELRAGLDQFTREEFAATTPVYYLPLELTTSFEPPIELKSPPAGRRFASDFEIAEARKAVDDNFDEIWLGERNGDDVEKALWGSPAGKKFMAKMLARLLPKHKTYVEAFAGSAAVFFAKDRSDCDVLNDGNDDIAFSFRFVQGVTEKQIRRLREFNWKATKSNRAHARSMKLGGDIERFYKIRFLSWSGFYSNPKSNLNPYRDGQTCKLVDKLPRGKQLLEGVKIYSGDYEKVVREFDKPSTVFFFDPPYLGFKQDVGEDEFDGDRFVKVLGSIKGKFLVTWGGDPAPTKKLFARFRIRSVMTLSGTPRGGVAEKRTWLISNYELPRIRKFEGTEKQSGRFERPHKCNMCDAQATKALIWADGRAFVPVCGAHEAGVRHHIEVKNKDSVCAVRPLPQPDAKAEFTTEALETDGGAKQPGAQPDPESGTDVMRAQQLSVRWVKVLPAFVKRTLPFVGDVGDAAAFIEGLPDFAAELRDELARIQTGEQKTGDEESAVAVGLKLGKLLPRVLKELTEDDAPADILRFLAVAIKRLERFAAIVRDFAKADDIAQIGKVGYAMMTPAELRELSDDELKTADERLHEFFVANFAETDKTTLDGTTREDLVNTELLIQDEMRRREPPLTHTTDDGLTAEAAALAGKAIKLAELAPTRASGESAGDVIGLADVLPHLKSFQVRSPILYMVGGLCNRGETENDIDLLIKGPVTPELRRVLEFRIGRMLPPELSGRVQFLDDDLGGPMTNHIELADLVVEVRPEFALKEMALAKQGSPLLDLPPVGAGPRPAVLQFHTRGKSNHADLRIQADGHLIGWTLFLGKPGVITEAIDTVAGARQLADSFSLEGDEFSKPLLAPKRVRAEPKSRQPLVWLKIDGEVFEPGEVGATSNEKGVVIAIDKPRAEFGMQTPSFHEYFFTKGKHLSGITNFRRLVGGAEASEEDIETGRVTPAGRAFWVASVSKDLLPSVLERRAVRIKRMPPDGYSAIPQSLERVTPKEFRYWEKKGAAARDARDALVDSRFFTADNIKLVDGEFRRVVTTSKMHLYMPESDEAPEPYASSFRASLAKQPRRAAFALSHQTFKGATVVRAAPSRQIWHLMFRSPSSGLDTWILQSNPITESSVAGIEKPRRQKDLLAFDGDVAPGQKIGGEVLNDTKATPSTIRVIDSGEAEFLDDQPALKKVRFRGKRLRGVYTLIQEEAGSRQWQMIKGAEPGRVVPADKKLSPEQKASYERESALIRENKKRPEARHRHKFVAAKWTHPNGHPRCLVCGDEETVSGICNDATEKRVPELLVKRAVASDQMGWVMDSLEAVDPVSKAAEDEIRRALDSTSSEQRVAMGVVLEPEVRDGQDDIYSHIEVSKAAEHFMAKFRNTRIMHQGEPINDRVGILGSFLAAKEFNIAKESVVRGTWVMFLRIADGEIWRAVLDEALTGLSIGGSAIRT